VLLARVFLYKTPVQVVYDVGTPPVQVRRDGGHVRGQERGDEKAQQPGRKVVTHGKHVALAGDRYVRVEDKRGQRHDDPGPGPQRVVRNCKPERGQHRVALVARRHHPLGHVSAASRLVPRVPGRPPLYGHVRQERRGGQGHDPRCDRGRFQGHGREKCEHVLRQLFRQPADTADFRKVQYHDSKGDAARHGYDELKHVRERDAPEARYGGVNAHYQHRADNIQDHVVFAYAEHDLEDRGQGQVDPAHDDDIHEYAKVHGLETAKESG